MLASANQLLVSTLSLTAVIDTHVSRVQKSTGIDEFSVLSASPLGGILSLGSEIEISGSFKNLRPENIDSEQYLIGIFRSQ